MRSKAVSTIGTCLLLVLGCATETAAIQRPRFAVADVKASKTAHREVPTSTTLEAVANLRGGYFRGMVGRTYSVGMAVQGCAELVQSFRGDQDPNLALLQKAKGATILSIALTPLLVYFKDMEALTAVAASLAPRYIFMLGLALVDRQKVQARMERLAPAYVICTIWALAVVKNGDTTLNPFKLEALTGAKLIGYQLLVAGSGLFLATELQGKLLNLDVPANKAFGDALGEQGILDTTDGIIKLAIILYGPAKSMGLACLAWFVMQCVNTKVMKRRPGGSAMKVHLQLIGALLGGLYLAKLKT
ncbi:expressed unknown protein [Seminavis robusta]|uniref:Uncharacterized protein n=1 Tax=Seminavis robusta TaxID=568900 RepID=A0A9N8DK46_9STRA|nr:expressed unknown protein [Seminavis robusta]|eukprot:Sro127_g060880.1 n/a (303) ;mRNA; r:72681-73589